MLWLPKLTGKRCIVTVHGLDWARAKWKGGFASKYIKFGERMAARRADGIIVLSAGVQKYFLETYGRETVFIPNGVNRPNMRPAEQIESELGLKGGEYLLYLGRIVPEKGIARLIEAFKQVETDRKLVIAGGSSYTDTFFQEMRLLAQDDPRIEFTGFVQGRLLEELFSNAYLYVLPSDLEGMPLSLLEAMSYGNCCFTSDIEECREVVGSHAVTFRRGDTADLAEKLSSLVASPKRVEAIRKGAAEYVCAKYSWNDVVHKTLLLYYEAGKHKTSAKPRLEHRENQARSG